MKHVILSLILALFVLGTMPAPASAQMQAYSQIDSSQGTLLPVAAGGRSISDMNIEHLLAVGVGAVLGITAIETLIGGGGLVTIVGLVGGALAGDVWYREGIWPFE